MKSGSFDARVGETGAERGVVVFFSDSPPGVQFVSANGDDAFPRTATTLSPNSFPSENSPVLLGAFVFESSFFKLSSSSSSFALSPTLEKSTNDFSLLVSFALLIFALSPLSLFPSTGGFVWNKTRVPGSRHGLGSCDEVSLGSCEVSLRFGEFALLDGRLALVLCLSPPTSFGNVSSMYAPNQCRATPNNILNTTNTQKPTANQSTSRNESEF